MSSLLSGQSSAHMQQHVSAAFLHKVVTHVRMQTYAVSLDNVLHILKACDHAFVLRVWQANSGQPLQCLAHLVKLVALCLPSQPGRLTALSSVSRYEQS